MKIAVLVLLLVIGMYFIGIAGYRHVSLTNTWQAYDCNDVCLNNLLAENEDIHTIVKVRYLGVGALDIRYKHYRILSDPFYTSHGIWDVLTASSLKSDQHQIAKVLGPPRQNVDAVVVGHGHYDHIADLPALKGYLKADARILGSPTSLNMIHSVFPSSTFIPIPAEPLDRQWNYIADGWIRMKGVPSEHAPQLLSINLIQGEVHHPSDQPPESAFQWKQGANINWVIDFLDGSYSNSDEGVTANNILKRIFLQTSAADFPIGLPTLTDQKNFDLAIIAAASFDNADHYPAGLIKQLQPQTLMYCHWENFFQPWWNQPTPLPLLNMDKLLRTSHQADKGMAVLVPLPGSWLTL